LKKYKKFWEEVIAYFPLNVAWKGIFTEPLPSNDGGTVTEPLPSNNNGIFTEPLPSNDRGIQRHTQTAT
jgi:hypothetical protein